MDPVEVLRILALTAVLKPNKDYQIRKIFRWYSKTFNTALHEVADLPLHDVLTAYYESMYEDMQAPTLEEERAELLASPEERERRLLEEYTQRFDDDQFARIIEERASEVKPEDHKKTKLISPIKKQAEASLPIPAELPPDITMEFISPDDFEREIDGFGLMDQPVKK